MKTDSINQKITLAGLTTLVKAAAVGFLIGEVWYLSQTVSNFLNRYIDSGGNEFVALILCGISLMLVVAYLYIRNCHSDFLKIVRSYRADILAMLLLGLYISVSFEGIGSNKYNEFVTFLSPGQLIPLVFVPLVIGLLLVMRALLINFVEKSDKEAPFFISDLEKKSKRDDLLDFSEDAARFAERVFNGGSADSIVFGIDAPWGIGKSTFVNFCTEYWEEKQKDLIIVYKFNLLRYEDRSNLLEKFVDGLVHTIQKHSFVPEIRPLISQYSRFIQRKGGFLRFGINLETLAGTYTVDDAFEDLEAALAHFNKKIIIVVDDLDRLSFSAIKDVLFAIKKSFTLPNISYVLCYDTENIVAQEKGSDGAEKVREFLEKFVNVKISLFLHAGTLSKYISQNFDRAVQYNLQLDPYTLEKLKQAISAIGDIFKSPDFHNYQAFLGDIRKLKRLINTLVLFEIEKTDFENSDFNKQDLIHLLLIYVNYPSIFRKIYNTETDSKNGFFSVVAPYDDAYPVDKENQAAAGHYSEKDYKNSRKYTKYLKGLTPNQKFLLNKVFAATERLENPQIDSVPEEIAKSYACFNGNSSGKVGRNLEEYLNLIVKLSKPQKRDQYKFYLNAKYRLLNGEPIEDVLSDEEFSFAKSENSRQQFWRVVVNSAHELNNDIGSQLITYLLDHIHEYSLFENSKIGVGVRDDLAYFLIKLLDAAGWSDPNGKHRNNNEENIAEIAEWIFGEKRHQDNGILDQLGAEDRGPLGIYDLMIFRLYCSADRGGKFFNLQNALSKHGDPEAPTSGMVSEIVVEEMREISQKVFGIINDQYITPGKNIFALIDQLTLTNLAGKYISFVEGEVASGEITEEEKNNSIAALKSRMKAFITYQLGNTVVGSGVGCGYYDENGKDDKNGISAKINDYLFDQCFDPSGGQINYEYFLDYLLINFTSIFDGEDGRSHIPTISEFTKVLNKARLAGYWKANSSAILALNLTEMEKEVVTGNYTASYKSDVGEVYKVLDELMTEVRREATSKVGTA